MIALAHRPATSLELPAHSRPWAKVPKRWRARGEWKQTRTKDGREEYAITAPYRLVFYGQHGGAKPKGLRVELTKGKPARFEAQKKRIGSPGSWGLKKRKLIVRTAQGAGPPGEVWVKLPRASEAERSLSMDTAGLTQERFAARTLDRRKSRTHGLFLPAPAAIAWTLEVPQRARLDLDAELLSPPVRTQHRSDGATVIVTVDAGDGPVEVLRSALRPGKQQDLQADLMAWAGQSVELAIRTEPGESPDLDYVFLGDPVLHSPKDDPRRALVVFVDTLRQDHLGTYGYPREVSPVIDALAAESAVFERAWAPSPWTLPSALAAAYGRAPEEIAGQEHLGELLGAQGWATCAVVSNNWLNAPDTLGSGWTEHRAHRGAKASAQAERAERCLSRYPDRDTLLFVHFIDPHFPYMEADKYRSRFAGEPPVELPDRVRHTHAKAAYEAAETDEERAAIRRYLIDRYDQNILAVDAAVGRLLAKVGDSAVVALFSDHGEEFWEHGGFEHGHSLYEELTRVPMMIRAPGIDPSRVQTPATLMDLVPTLGALLGLPAADDQASGENLLGVIRGEPAAEARLVDRSIEMGRPLFGDDLWGIVHRDKKWVVGGGQQQLWDLGVDPGETKDLAAETDLGPWPARLSTALHRPVERVIRIVGPGTKRHITGGRSELKVRHPMPIQAAWTRLDPHGSLADPELVEGEVRVARAKGQKVPREVFVQLAAGAPSAGLEVHWRYRGTEHLGSTAASKTAGPLLILGEGGSAMTVGWTWQPTPRGDGVRYSGEVTEEMRALGYLE